MNFYAQSVCLIVTPLEGNYSKPLALAQWRAPHSWMLAGKARRNGTGSLTTGVVGRDIASVI